MPHTSPARVSTEDLFRYRYQHGINIGSAFIHGPGPETDPPTKDPKGLCESKHVKNSIKSVGVEKTRTVWCMHALDALDESDFAFLKESARCNSIRLPIAYYTLGPALCLGTPFDGEVAQVYKDTWRIAKHLIERCYKYGIGVLIDFCIAPSEDTHAHGESYQHIPEDEACPVNRALARDCVAFILQEVTFHSLRAVIGIQISCQLDCPRDKDLNDWHDEILEVTSAIDPSLPIYISDDGNLSSALAYTASKNKLPAPGGRSPVVVETRRLYNTFTDPKAIMQQIANELSELDSQPNRLISQDGAVDVYIGEYNCTLHPQAWKHTDPSERQALTKQLGQTQTQHWTSKTSGSAFSPFKHNPHNHTSKTQSQEQNQKQDESFIHHIQTNSLPPPPFLTIPPQQVTTKLTLAKSQRPDLREKALSHLASPNSSFEQRRRYDLGWTVGFDDSMHFFASGVEGTVPGHSAGGDVIGALELWMRKRMLDTREMAEDLGVEWEVGFRRGVRDFRACVGV